MEIAFPLKVRRSDVKEYTLLNDPGLSCCWSQSLPESPLRGLPESPLRGLPESPLEKSASFSFTQ